MMMDLDNQLEDLDKLIEEVTIFLDDLDYFLGHKPAASKQQKMKIGRRKESEVGLAEN